MKQDHTENETLSKYLQHPIQQISSEEISEYDKYLKANIYDGIYAYSDTGSWLFFLDGFKWSLLVSMIFFYGKNNKKRVKIA